MKRGNNLAENQKSSKKSKINSEEILNDGDEIVDSANNESDLNDSDPLPTEVVKGREVIVIFDQGLI